MKRKIFVIALCLAIVATCAFAFVACNDNEETYEIAVVTDVGQLMDGGFNQGTYEGAKAYAEANGKTYKFYQPANGADATDNDRVAAMRQAIANGAKVIVAPGFLQATAMETVAKESPDVKFVFVDGWAMGLSNVTAIVYKEQESGFMAGYAAVKDGYTKLGGTFGGGGTNPACNRFAYGYVQGINAAAAALGKTVDVKLSFLYGDNFSASTELQTQITGWYEGGTEVVFACGGSMFQSVKAAAELKPNAKIIGVDVDQSTLSDRVITSAVKGLSVSVQKVLGELYNGEWDTKLADKASNLGATDDATGIPYATSRFASFTEAEYNTLFNAIKDGTVVIDAENCDDVSATEWWTERVGANVNFTLEK